MDHIVGHTQQVSYLNTLVDASSFSHAYMFAGPEHVGKRGVAEAFCARILKITQEKLKSHPDFFYLTRGVDPKKNTLKKDISIAQVRELVTFAVQRPFYAGGYKCVIVDGVEYMSRAASNALLKTLEEPGVRTILVLISHNTDLVLRTILSRCQIVRFSGLSRSDMNAYADTLSVVDRERMVTMAHGKPGLLRVWHDDAEEYARVCEVQDQFVGMFEQSFFERLSSIETLFGDKTDHIAQRQKLYETLQMWHVGLGSLGSARERVSVEQILELDERIDRAKQKIFQNIHPRLLVESILLAIP